MPHNHHFWKQINHSVQSYQPLNKSYDTVLQTQFLNKIKQSSLVEEYDLVAERVGLNAQVSKALERAFPGWKYTAPKKGAIRLQPIDKNNAPVLSDEQIKSGIESQGYKYIASHPPTPNAGGYTFTGSKSRSGAFATHEFEVSGLPVLVVFGTGGNEGNKFERNTNIEMIQQKENHPLLKPLLPLIAPDTIAAVAIRSGSTRRPFTGEIEDVGPIIGDTIVGGQSGEMYFLSLKNVGGVTISNHGCAGIFTSWDNEGKLKFNPNAFPAITELFEAAGVDTDKMIYNLTQYINAHHNKEYQAVPSEDVPINQNLDAIEKYILSSIGYGYYYARDKGGGKLQFEDLSTPEAAKSFVGNVQRAILRYPYVVAPTRSKSRKGLDIICFTDKGWRFTFQFRNAEGGLVPRQLNLMITGNGIPEPISQEA
jgi:hypothetical protein